MARHRSSSGRQWIARLIKCIVRSLRCLKREQTVHVLLVQHFSQLSRRRRITRGAIRAPAVNLEVVDLVGCVDVLSLFNYIS